MAASSAAKGAGGGRQALLLSVLGILLVGTLVVRWALEREPGTVYEDAPEVVRGRWTTAEPRYAGRAIEVSAKDVVVHRGEAGPLAGRLTAARELVEDGDRVIRLEYVNSDGANTLDMVLRPGGSMHLRNQPEIVWTAGGMPPPPTAVAAAAPSNPSPPSGRFPVGLLLAGLAGGAVLLIVGLGGLRLAGATADEGVAPGAVRGVWTTMDERFAGQSIRIASGYAFSQFGPGDVRVGGVITEADEWREDDARIVSLAYEGRDGADRIEMVLDRSGHMRLRNGPKSVWVRR